MWDGSGSPQINTIASRDQFKPIRIGEKLVVNLTLYSREIKFDVTWSYVIRQTAKMKLLPSVFTSLNSRENICICGE